MEWWKSDGVSFQALTLGLNYRPHANVVIRPEIRNDWTNSNAGAQALGFNGQNDYDNWSFGMDAIITF